MRPSSHNPDLTGTPEWRDGDKVNEVRARDIDKDLRTPGLTMLMVVRHLVEGAREGRFWWLRYIIFQGVIYHRSHGWQARTYTGANSHHEHAHVNNDFSQAADNAVVTYGLREIAMPTVEEFAAAVWEHKLPNGTTAQGNVVTMLARSGEQQARMAAVPAQFAAIAGAVAQIVPEDIDEDALATALAAKLPDDSDDISADELKQAIVAAVQELLEPTTPPATE